MDLWVPEIAPPDDGSPTFGGPADVFERVRSGPPDEQDRQAHREDLEREQRKAEARERQRDHIDAMRLRGEPIMSVSESLQVRSAVWFAAQDRADKESDRALRAMGEQLHVERRRLAALERQLREERESKRSALREANSAHAARRAAETVNYARTTARYR
jgi:hypothetical protein